jgi:2-keto-4-pentenoate hydratase/2-oxohepta-3-ene-1,7-dioic acid hydratase in catechol pathway
MKLASFSVQTAIGPVTRVGIAKDGSLIDVTAGYELVLAEAGEAAPEAISQAHAPPSMSAFLQRGNRALEAAREARDLVIETERQTSPSGAQLRYNESDVRLLSPLPRPNSIRDFAVFEGHLENLLGEAVADEWYEMPTFYKGNPDSIVHPNEEVVWPSYSDQMDYELELAAVVGRAGRNVSPEEATDYLAGFTIFNDFSARDTQREMNVGMGPSKSKDFANALGPYLVTTDAFELDNARMIARVNGEIRSEGHATDMYHDWGDIIAHVSREETIKPGDVLGSGTVLEGSGAELGRLLEDGDRIELEIEGIGTLSNRVVSAG